VAIWSALDEADAADKLKAAGYDGIIFTEKDGAVSYAVPDATQIKAVNNGGNFDPNNPSITASKKTAGDDQLPTWEGFVKHYGNFDDMLNECADNGCYVEEKDAAMRQLRSNFDLATDELWNVKFPLVLYRTVYLPEAADISALRTDNIGVCWRTEEEDGCNSYMEPYGNGPNVKWHLKAKVVTPRDVDWMGTMYARIHPEYGAVEKEIRLKEDAVIYLLAYRKQDEPWHRVRSKAVTASVDSPEFKTWFKNSKIVDAKGNPAVVFHQTHKDNTTPILQNGFDLSKGKARLGDSEMPDGIFFKPDTAHIGVGGGVDEVAQMPFYLSIQNPLRVQDREELTRFLSQDDEYASLIMDVREYNSRCQQGFDKLRTELMAGLQRGDYATKVSPKLHEYIKGWEENDMQKSSASRARVTQVLRQKGYDGLIMEHDRGSFGRTVKTIMALDPEQVQSVRNYDEEQHPKFSAARNKTILYLDDVRVPDAPNCVHVRNYDEFVKYLKTHKMPDVISLDHDLAEEHLPYPEEEDIRMETRSIPYETYKEKTGLDCIRYIIDNKLPLKQWDIHSTNAVGGYKMMDMLFDYCPKGYKSMHIPFHSEEEKVYGGRVQNGFRIRKTVEKGTGK
jgi:hypothetical protein